MPNIVQGYGIDAAGWGGWFDGKKMGALSNSPDNGTFPNVIGMFIHGLIPHEIAAVTLSK